MRGVTPRSAILTMTCGTPTKNLLRFSPTNTSRCRTHTRAQSSSRANPSVSISASASRSFMIVSSVPSLSKSSIQPNWRSIRMYSMPSVSVPIASPINPAIRQPSVFLNRSVPRRSVPIYSRMNHCDGVVGTHR